MARSSGRRKKRETDAEKRCSPMVSATPSSSLTGLVLSHFDLHQRGGAGGTEDDGGGVKGRGALDAPSRASRIRDDLSSELLNRYITSAASLGDSDDDGARSTVEEIVTVAREEIGSAIVWCVDTAMEATASAKSAAEASQFEDCTDRTLELAAALGCHRGDGTIGAIIVERAALMASRVLNDGVRSKACRLLGLCAAYALSGAGDGGGDSGGRKGKKATNGKRKDDISTFLYGDGDSKEDGELQSWRAKHVNACASSLLPRLIDKSQSVRLAAAQASGALFQRKNGFDNGPCNEVLKFLLDRVSHDSSFACRAAAARALPVTEVTVPQLLDRVRDVKAKVRVDVLDYLWRSADVLEDFSEEQRVEVLQSGLTERCCETNRATVKMLCCGWMKALKFDPVNLLRHLNPVDNEAVCERAVRAIISTANNNAEDVLKHLSDPEICAFKESVGRKISLEDTTSALDPAAALYLRVMCEETEKSTSISPSEKASALGKLLPDIPALCEALRRHLQRLIDLMRMTENSINDVSSENEEIQEISDSEDTECFVCAQLLKLARHSTDLQEEGSRRYFVSLMCDMLSSIETPEDLVEGCILALHAAHDTEARFLQTVSEIASNVTDNCTAAVEAASDEIEDSARQVRVVSILSLALENVSASTALSASNAILEGLSSHIVPAVTSSSAAAREAGVGCLGRYALLAGHERVFGEFRPLLLKVCSNTEERIEVRAQAAMALCDLNLVFREETEMEVPNDDISFSFLLSEMLCHSNSALVAVAAEIVAKLFLSGRMLQPTLLAHLITIFFDKDLSETASACGSDAEDGDEEAAREVGSFVRMQQILSIFFPALAIKGTEGRRALTDCIRPMLYLVEEKMVTKVKTQKGRNTRTLSWPIAKMIEFICSTVDSGIEDLSNAHTPAKEGTPEFAAGHPGNEANLQKEQQPTSTLLASIAISEYLLEQSANSSATYLRALCKILGGAFIDVGIDDRKCLSILKKNMDHLAMIITDDSSVRSIEKLMCLLDEVESEGEGEKEEKSVFSMIEAMQKTTIENGTKNENISEGCFEIDTNIKSENVSFEAVNIAPEGKVDHLSDGDDDFFDELFSTKDSVDIVRTDDSDISSYSSKENVSSSRRRKGKKDSEMGKTSTATKRNNARTRRQLTDVNA